FGIQNGWVSPNGRHAFLNVCRVPPPAIDHDRTYAWENRSTAILVDLPLQDWRIPGTVDESVFLGNSSCESRQVIGDEREILQLELVDGGKRSIYGLDEARALSPEEVR